MKPLLPVVLLLTACSGDIYLRDGVTDGDTFYLSNRAVTDSDPVLQSWASYSLTKSACQLSIGGDNPARASSFDCELTGRRHLLDTWSELGGEAADDYLDDLAAVRAAGFLDEYVAHYLGRHTWNIPATVESQAFDDWRRTHLRHHRSETRIIGAWGYTSRDERR